MRVRAEAGLGASPHAPTCTGLPFALFERRRQTAPYVRKQAHEDAVLPIAFLPVLLAVPVLAFPVLLVCLPESVYRPLIPFSLLSVHVVLHPRPEHHADTPAWQHPTEHGGVYVNGPPCTIVRRVRCTEPMPRQPTQNGECETNRYGKESVPEWAIGWPGEVSRILSHWLPLAVGLAQSLRPTIRTRNVWLFVP